MWRFDICSGGYGFAAVAAAAAARVAWVYRGMSGGCWF
jgi:hypothetical protein